MPIWFGITKNTEEHNNTIDIINRLAILEVKVENIKDSITQQKNNRHFAISTWISITCIIISLFSAYFTFKGYEVAKQQEQSSEQPDRQQ